MSTFLQDLRFAFRVLAKSPGYTAAVILVLALGVGGTSTVFTIVNGVLLEPLPFKNPSQLVTVGGAASVPYGDTLKYWGQGKIFSIVATCANGGVNLAGAGEPERVPAATVSASFFPLFGAHPEIGRGFAPEDETPDRNHIVVLSHRFWQRNFAGDKAVLGREVALNGEFHTIVGVMPLGFGYPGHTDVWTLRIANTEQRRGNELGLGTDKQPDAPVGCRFLARLRDGASLAEARREMNDLLDRYDSTFYPGQKRARGMILVHPLQELLVRESRTGLWILLGAVGFLLLIACVNAAHMILVRATTRQKEIAVRLCMGASRWRILRQLLTESTVLALAASAAGILISFWGVRAIQAFGPKDVPRLSDVRLDVRVLGFALGLSLLIGVFVGLTPALQTMAQDLTRTLKQESSRATGALRKRLRGAMIISEVAMTLILLMGAGLMIRSLRNLLQTQPGFATQNVITMDFALPQAAYISSSVGPNAAGPGVSRVTEFYQRISAAIGSLPGVVSVAETAALPLGGKGRGGLYLTAGRCKAIIQGMDVSADYFRAMSIPVLAGRVFAERDTSDPKYGIVISQAMARSCWPGGDALGNFVELQGGGFKQGPRQVIGIVGDVKFQTLGNEDSFAGRRDVAPGAVYYLPANPLDATLIVRAESDPKLLVPAIRERVRRLDPGVPLFNIRTMTEVLSDSMSAPRFRGFALGIFAGLALVLAVFGLYSVVAYSVACRTHELGVRMALGAQPRDILLMVAREGMWLALAGIALGTIGSYWTNKLIATFLYGVRPTDPATVVAAAVILAAGTIVACIIPARRASSVHPSAALRYE